jgi:hypothetical protein
MQNALEKILNEEVKDEKTNLYVTKVLSRFLKYNAYICKLEDKKIAEFLLNLTQKEIKLHVVERKFQDKVEKFLLNVITAIYREKKKFLQNEKKQQQMIKRYGK